MFSGELPNMQSQIEGKGGRECELELETEHTECCRPGYGWAHWGRLQCSRVMLSHWNRNTLPTITSNTTHANLILCIYRVSGKWLSIFKYINMEVTFRSPCIRLVHIYCKGFLLNLLRNSRNKYDDTATTTTKVIIATTIKAIIITNEVIMLITKNK